MKNFLRGVFATVVVVVVLTGCGGGGDININAPNNSTTSLLTTGGAGDVTTSNCAHYEDPASGARREGTQDGNNCVYSSNFVSGSNPLMTNLTIPNISGVHIFEDMLQVGEDVSDGPISEGPTLTIEAGTTVAWTSPSDYLLITRGSKINASGEEGKPIILTGYEDAVADVADPFATQLWGGVVINGRGVTNKCDDDQRSTDTCHIESEGQPSHYGGNNNADNSGVLKYVIIKHSGSEAAPGDELNGLTLNAVGSNTIIENLQVYSTFDDGVEFFGGAVNVKNLVALYVRDDSIDYADGWVGSVTNALVIHHQSDGNRCIEADNQGSAFSAQPLTNASVAHLTCIISGNDEGTHGDSEGVLLRRGVATQLRDSIVYDGYARTVLSNSGNECLELDDVETRAHAADGTTTVKSSLIACQEATKDSLENGDSVGAWLTDSVKYDFNSGNVIETQSDDADVRVLGGSKGFFTLSTLVGADGQTINITSTDGTPIGAVTESDDWTAGWTICLEPKSSSDCGLWFLD